MNVRQLYLHRLPHLPEEHEWGVDRNQRTPWSVAGPIAVKGPPSQWCFNSPDRHWTSLRSSSSGNAGTRIHLQLEWAHEVQGCQNRAAAEKGFTGLKNGLTCSWPDKWLLDAGQTGERGNHIRNVTAKTNVISSHPQELAELTPGLGCRILLDGLDSGTNRAHLTLSHLLSKVGNHVSTKLKFG